MTKNGHHAKSLPSISTIRCVMKKYIQIQKVNFLWDIYSINTGTRHNLAIKIIISKLNSKVFANQTRQGQYGAHKSIIFAVKGMEHLIRIEPYFKVNVMVTYHFYE